MLQAAVGEGQQRSVQGALGVLEDGIVLVDVLHHLRVELVLLQSKGEKDAWDKEVEGEWETRSGSGPTISRHMPSIFTQGQNSNQ